MLSIYLVRHGQTELSRSNAFCGSSDPPLSDLGHRMAEAFAARYGDEAWAAIYASPMVRARQTAEPTVRRSGVALAIDPDLREIEYGEWEGRSEEEVARAEPDRFHAWSDNPGHTSPPGGESAYQIAARVTGALARIRARHESGKVLVVSHKATLRVLVCALLGVDPNFFRARIAQPVCSLTVFELRPRGALLARLGDVSHLPPALAAAEGT